MADVAGFADPDDDDFTAFFEGGHHGFNGAVKRGIKQRAHGFEGRNFNIKNFSGSGKMAHAGSLPAMAWDFNREA